MDELARERVDRPERRDEQRDERREVDQRRTRRAGGAEQPQRRLQPRPAPERAAERGGALRRRTPPAQPLSCWSRPAATSCSPCSPSCRCRSRRPASSRSGSAGSTTSGAFGVVLRARALGDLVHLLAGELVRPASRRSRSPAAPAPSASRSRRATCRRSRGSSSSPTPSTCRASRSRPPSGRCPSPAPWRPGACSSGTATTRRSTASPFLNRSISSEASAQYFLISGFCCFSRLIAASNCVSFSSYGSLIPSARLASSSGRAPRRRSGSGCPGP